MPNRPACVVKNEAPTCWLPGKGHGPVLLNFLKVVSGPERVGEQLSHEVVVAQEDSADATLLFFSHRSTPQEKMERKEFSSPSLESPQQTFLHPLPQKQVPESSSSTSAPTTHNPQPSTFVCHSFLWAPQQNSFSRNYNKMNYVSQFPPPSHFSKTRWKSNSGRLRIAVQIQQQQWAFCLFIGHD